MAMQLKQQRFIRSAAKLDHITGQCLRISLPNHVGQYKEKPSWMFDEIKATTTSDTCYHHERASKTHKWA